MEIDESKTPLQTPLLPDEITFDDSRLACVPILKLEYWDLVDHKNFPHLETKQLIHCIIEKNMTMTKLESQRWLKGVEKVVLFNLLWVSHYNHTLVTVLVIKQLLCLVHDRCLCLEELIPITDRLIH